MDVSTSRDRQLAVSYREAAQMLGVCERVVWGLVKQQRLKAMKIGRSVRIPISELKRFIDESAGINKSTPVVDAA